MASRVIEAGSVVTRTQFLLLTGVLKRRPLWLDIAEAFPPVETLPPPHKARHLHKGKAKSISYFQDSLKRYAYSFVYALSSSGGSPFICVLTSIEWGKEV